MVRVHDLRHSCASILFALGYDFLTIQEIWGHVQLTTTMAYTRILIEKKNDALVNISNQLMGDEECAQGERDK